MVKEEEEKEKKWKEVHVGWSSTVRNDWYDTIRFMEIESEKEV